MESRRAKQRKKNHEITGRPRDPREKECARQVKPLPQRRDPAGAANRIGGLTHCDESSNPNVPGAENGTIPSYGYRHSGRGIRVWGHPEDTEEEKKEGKEKREGQKGGREKKKTKKRRGGEKKGKERNKPC